MASRSREAAVAAALVLLAAVYFVLIELHRPAPVPSFDLYNYYLPNMLHAVESVWRGGQGLL